MDGNLQESEIAGKEKEIPAPTVLLVEDEDPLRHVIAETLESKGFQVLSAATAEEAVRMADGLGREIDVLLTDLSLPRMDGYSLAAKLGSSGAARRIIYMSGYSEANPERVSPIGGRRPEYVEKPFRLRELLETVNRALQS